jgi:hypothetical protein
MQRRSPGGSLVIKHVFRSALFIALCTVILETAVESSAFAQGAPPNVQMLKLPDPAVRTSTAKALLANWQGSLASLIEAVNGFDGKSIDGGLSKEDLDYLTRVTDVLRSIVVNNSPQAIQRFREIDKASTIRPLIWAARSSNQDLRVNATYILANVADNTNVCILLRHLREKDISTNGVVNLLQIAIAISSYIYKENYVDAKATLVELRTNLATRQEDVSRAYALIDDLSKRLEASINKNEGLPQALSFCKTDEAKRL